MKNNKKKKKRRKIKNKQKRTLQEVKYKNTRKDETKNLKSPHEVDELFLNTSTKITIRR